MFTDTSLFKGLKIEKKQKKNMKKVKIKNKIN